MSTRQIGLQGEEQAARLLQHKGYRLIARNFTAAGGEIDLIALDGKTLVFVEVKKRASMAFGGPVAAVTPAKRKRISLAAMQYLKANPPKFDSIRFDVVCVLPGQVEHIMHAFEPERTTL